MVIPAAYNSAKGEPSRHNNSLSFFDGQDPEVDPGTQASLLIISRGTAILLLGVYVAYLIFQVSLQVCSVVVRLLNYIVQLKTHEYLFRSPEDEEEEPPHMSTISAGSAYVYLSLF
jgi:Ca2+:H+ antiporter